VFWQRCSHRFTLAFSPSNQLSKYGTSAAKKNVFFKAEQSRGGWCRVGVAFWACFGQKSKKNGYSSFNTLLCSLRIDEIMKGPEGFMTDYDGLLACFGKFFKKLHRPLSMFLC
jgi:hypothetical protein